MFAWKSWLRPEQLLAAVLLTCPVVAQAQPQPDAVLPPLPLLPPPPGVAPVEAAKPSDAKVQPVQGVVQPKNDVPLQLPQPQKLPPNADPAHTRVKLVEITDLSILDAMKLLSKQTNVDIVVSAEASKDQKLKVNVLLRDKTPDQIIREITAQHGLLVRVEKGIYRVSTTKEAQHYLTTNLEEQTRIYTLLYPNAFNVAQAISELLGDKVKVGFGMTPDSLVFSDLTQRFTRFDLLNSRSLGLGIAQTGGIGTGGFGGGGFGGFGVPFGGGILNQQIQAQRTAQQDIRADDRSKALTPEEFQGLIDALGTKEGPDRAKLFALTLAQRTQNVNTYVTVIKSNNQLVVRSSDPNVLTQIDDLVCKLDIPTPAVLLEMKVLAIDLQDDFTSTFDMQFTDGALVSGSFTTGNILPPFADQLAPDARRFATIAPGPLGTAPTRSALFQVVSANFRARLQMLEDKKRITQLATPLLMTANNEVSQIFTGAQIPVTVGFNPAITNTTVAAATTTVGTPITVLQNIGTTLLITPNINADRTVTLRIQQENSTVKKNGATIPVVSGDGATINQVPVDTVERNTLTGTFIAKDGLTMAIAGLIQEGATDVRSEVPVLGRLPYLGIFFRSQATQRKRTEIVVLIRPYILSTALESANVTRAVLQNSSLHPNVQAENLSGLGTFMPHEVIVPNPPVTPLQRLFRVHMVQPKDY